MQKRVASILVFSIAALGWASVCASAAPQQEQPKAQKKSPPKKAAQASLSGCVDQQDGKYILIHDQTRNPIANLEADGFETEGFAKHVGHKVTVRGTSNPSGTDRPVFKVRSVEMISETCGPQAQ
jgi:hypothetical protein